MESQDVCLIQHIFFSKNQEKFIFKHKKNEHWVNIETLQNISHVYDTKITVSAISSMTERQMVHVSNDAL